MPEIPFNFLNRRSKTTGFRPTDLQDGQIYIQQADEAILFKNDLGSLVCVSIKTGAFVTTGQTGAFGGGTVDLNGYVTTGATGSFVTSGQTGILSWSGHTHAEYVSTGATGSFVTTGQTGNFASLDGSNYLRSTQIPNITGDVCINAGSRVSTVYKIQGYPVANTQPVNGQTLQFDGSSWVPGDIAAGGNGGGGLVYYFNETIAADLPTGSLPTSYSGTYELGRTGMINQISFETPHLPQAAYSGVVGFISDVLDPQTTSIPAGLFDFNIWASSNTATQTILKLEVYKYDGATTTASLLASSDDVYTYDGTVTAQYILSVVLPQTTISSTDRLYIRILAKALATNKHITLYFGGNTPSHVHTTIPAVGGSGLIKVINGIMQSSASALVDADVSASAAIAGTKIQANYFALANATGSFVTTGQTGILSWSGHTHAQYVSTGSTGAFVTTGQTGVFALSANTGAFVTTGQTGTLSSSGHTHAQYVNTGSTGAFVTTGQTGSFGGSNNGVLASNVGNLITSSANSFIGAGQANSVLCSCYSSVLGGCQNYIFGNFAYCSKSSAIVGGEYNAILCADYSNVLGGIENCIKLGGVSSILGGIYNCIISGCENSIGAGEFNAIKSSYFSFISAGQNNLICNSSGINILGSGINVSGKINTTYVNNICSTGGKYYGDGSSLTGLATGAFVTTGQTGVFALSANTGAFVTTGQTGSLSWSGHTHAQYVSTGSTGAFVTTGQTGAFANAGIIVAVNTVTATGYNISSSDYNTIIRYSGSSITNSGLFIIPNNISNFQVGGSVLIAQVSSGQAYFTGAAGTTLLINGSKSRTSARGATATLTYIATNEWLINGDIV